MLDVPKIVPYMVSRENTRLLKIIDARAKRGENCNVLVSGMQGSGKSELITQFAATRTRPLCIVQIGRLSGADEIYGRIDLRANPDGSSYTEYIPSQFTEALQTPNAVIHLEEINRGESDKALNAIYSVLQERKIWIDELGKAIHVAEGVTFFASMNEGYEFVGTLPLDEALRSRFAFKLNLGQLPRKTVEMMLTMRVGITLTQIEQLLDMCISLQSNTQNPIYIATRDILNIAALMKDELPMMLALKTVISGADEVIENMLLSAHLDGENAGFDFEDARTYEVMIPSTNWIRN
jgi:nitric oxide reductase NorQ protein